MLLIDFVSIMSLNKLIPFIIIKTIEHLELTFITIFLATSIAIPMSFLLAKLRKNIISKCFLKVALELQNVPPLALIGFLMALLIFLQKFIIFKITGVIPGIFILVVFALMPILCHTSEGLKNKNLKLKYLLPSILEGIRISTVLTVGVATLVSLIGSGGLGDIILKGLDALNIELILAGSLPAAFLGIILNWLIRTISKWILLTKKS